MNWNRFWRRRNPDRDLDEEIRAHLRMAADDRMGRGEDPLDAERNARGEFGNDLMVRETTRDMWAWAACERVTQDLKYGLRRARSNKGFALLTVLTIALGIGVNTSMFTLLHAVMFNTLPVSRPDELYRLGRGDNCCYMTGYQNGQDFALFSWDLYKTLLAGTPEIRDLAAFGARPQLVTVRRGGSADAGNSFEAEYVSGNYFELFGIHPALGRFFQAGDDTRGASPTVVISQHAWRTYLGSDPGIVGAPLLIKGKPFTVVGVAPAEFYGETLRSDPPDCWLPISMEPVFEGGNNVLDRPGQLWLYLMGRVPASMSLRALEAKVNGEAKQWFYALAGSAVSEKDRRRIESQFVPLTAAAGGVETMSIAYRSGLVLLMGLSSLVLLVACANVANLLLARAAVLRGQNSLKVALGASRARMLWQALTDSLLLSLSGGVAGLGVAYATTRLIVLLAFRGARFVPIAAAPSAMVLAFAFAVSVITGLLFGIVPAWIETRSDPADALRGASRSTPSATLLPQKILLVAQAAMSFVLLTGAGLLTESLWNLQRQHFGFRTEQRMVVKVNPAFRDYTLERLTTTYRALQERLARLPGVAHIGLANYLPMTGNNRNTHIWMEAEGNEYRPGDVSYDRVSPGYFEAIGTSLLEGRSIDETDRQATRRVAVVNQTFAERYCKGRSPLGMRFGIRGPEHAADYEIVGVVEDAKYSSTRLPAYATFFLPLLQPELNPQGVLSGDSIVGGIALHVTLGDGSLEPLLRRAIEQTDPNLGVAGIKSYEEQLASYFNQERLLATLTQLFAALALVLGSIGLYGLVALAASRRTAEIGVRMALGATRSQVVAMIVSGALGPVGLGIAIGLPASLLGTRWMQHQLFGVSAWNPAAMMGAALLLVGCAMVAALVPASRAANLDPTLALRRE